VTGSWTTLQTGLDFYPGRTGLGICLASGQTAIKLILVRLRNPERGQFLKDNRGDEVLLVIGTLLNFGNCLLQ